MKPSPFPHSAPAQRAPVRLLAPMPVLLALSFSLLATGCFRPSNHVRVLRDAVIDASGEEWAKEIELGVGSLTFGLARAGTAFFDLPPEARTVLRSVRGADVGVYRLRQADRPVPGWELLSAADRTLSDRGWDRLVGVIDGPRETVAVYVPQELKSTRRMRICVLVVDGPEMVIVSARGNPEPLMTLALEQAQRELRLTATK